MKKSVLTFLLIISVFFQLKASDGKSKAAVVQLLQQLDSARTLPQYLELAHAFERVAQADKKSWYPVYYASYCYILATFREKNKTTADQYADKAVELAEKADKLQPRNSEIQTLIGYSCQARLSVYPMERSMTMAARSSKYFEKAMQLDSQNPRPYFLRSQNLYHTPKALGGGQEKACTLARKAAGLFQGNKADDRDPAWGEKANEMFLKKCQ